MKHVISILEVSLETMTTNEPINRQRGNTEQADLEAETAAEIRHALAKLEEKEPSDFGWAIRHLKAGRRVRRAGWNGKGMFLFLLPAGDGIPTKVIHDPALRAVIESEVGGDAFDALGSIRMLTADKKVLTGWLASQTDILSDDWEVIPT